MVTLYQVRAYLAQLQRLVDGSVADVAMTVEVVDWLHSITEILSTAPVDETNEAADLQRKQLLDALGSSYSDYRRRIYGPGFTGTSRVPLRDLGRLCHLALAHIDATISANKRNDGLFQSYNLISISDDGERASLDRLGEMLEGQVAVIESGVLGPDECGDVVDALFASALFRADQHSFLLYPAERLPSFLDRNVVPPSEIEGNLLLSELLDESKEVIVVRDVDGRIRFDSDLVTRGHLEKRLDRIANDPNYEDLVAAHRAATLDIYERVFRHRSYTGRSGSMYAYEGIGSIYWHMVAKLLVAIQEAAFRFARSGVSPESLDRLVSSYWNVRSGLGFNKTPAEHGAIPIDPYSHTPSHAGAQQPGMTGLVKEELLIRPAELGVVVEEGEIVFDSTFLSVSELIAKPFRWRTLDVSLERQDLELPAGSFALTVCQVPVVVQPHSGDARIEVEHASGAVSHIEGQSLGKVLSAQVFGRTGQVRAIRAHLPPADSS